MKHYRINPGFVIRKYGNILLGYFETDEQMRYYTFEGLVAEFLIAAMDWNTLMNSAVTIEPGYDEKLEKDIHMLEELKIIEVL